jgi:hypothetical protein
VFSLIGSHVRHNVVAYLALFFALSGSAAAAGALMRQGDQAGGDLAGSYPDPTIAPNAVGTNEVDGSLTGSDVSDAGGGTLTGADILESSLGKVGDADTLDGQNSTAFLGATAKAADADQLDGQDSTDFLGAAAKSADSDQLDGQDSTDFLGAAAKSADSDQLDGQDSTDFARLWGFVNDDGTVERGSGFTVQKLGTGQYRLFFPDDTFRGCHFPITVTPFGGGPRIASISGVGCTGTTGGADGRGDFIVQLFDLSGTPRDNKFMFIVL